MRIIRTIIILACLPFLANAETINEKLNNAEIYISVGEYKEALEILKDLHNLSVKDEAERDYLLGQLYFSIGKFNKANEFFDLAALANSEEGKYLVGLAESYYALGKIKIAKSNAKFALISNPDLISAELILAKIDNKLGNQGEAIKRFELLLELQPSNENVILNFAKYLEERSEIGKAINLIKDFILKYPDSPYVIDYLGQLYWFSGNTIKAIEYRSQASIIFEKQGKIINSNAIKKWIANNTSIIELDKKPENNNPDLPSQNPPRYILNSPNEIEPFPVNSNEWIGTGSGFIVNNGKNIVTNHHVIKGAQRIYVRNGIGELREAKVEFISNTDDLALLSLNKDYDSKYALEIPINDNLRVGMDSVIMGYPLSSVLGDTSPSLTEGIVSKSSGLNDNPGTFILTSKLNKGNSGGPIFSSNGELIGVAVAKLNKTKIFEENDFIPEDVNIGIKISRVKQMLEPNNTIQASNIKYDLADLYEQKLPSVVMIVAVLPPPDDESGINELDEAIKDCQSKYSSEIDFSKKQYDEFCVCYFNGIVEVYTDEEAEYERQNGKISKELEIKIEDIGNSCVQKVQ